VRVTYLLTAANELIVEYEATTDRATPINLTQHTYFNLGGGARNILDHELTIDADRFTPTDDNQIPTGELKAVGGTPFDFTRPSRIGARIGEDDPQVRTAGGYDHNWVLRDGGMLARAARLVDPESGRTLEVSTTEPGIQFYSGNRLERPRMGLCLETQHFPDSPNHPAFPSTILRPGGTYRSKTVFAFGVV